MKKVKLGSICTKIGSGFTPRGGKSVYTNSGTALIRSQNVLDMSMTKSGLVYISDEQAGLMCGVEVQKGDVLLNITGDSVARVAVVDEDFLPARVNQHVAIVRPDKTKLLSDYLQYYLQMQKNHLLAIASSNSTRNALTKEIISELDIDIPPIIEQKRVVKILDLLQEKIKTNNAINDNLQQMIKTAFGFQFARRKSNGKLKDIVIEHDKSTVQVNDSEGVAGEYPFFTSGETINEWQSYMVDGINCYLSTGGNATIKAYSGKAAYSTDTWCISGKGNYSAYLYCYLKSIIKSINTSYFAGSGLKHLQKDGLLLVDLYIPTAEELKIFNNVAIVALNQCSELYRENKALVRQRDFLLPLLMNGQAVITV